MSKCDCGNELRYISCIDATICITCDLTKDQRKRIEVIETMTNDKVSMPYGNKRLGQRILEDE